MDSKLSFFFHFIFYLLRVLRLHRFFFCIADLVGLLLMLSVVFEYPLLPHQSFSLLGIGLIELHDVGSRLLKQGYQGRVLCELTDPFQYELMIAPALRFSAS